MHVLTLKNLDHVLMMYVLYLNKVSGQWSKLALKTSAVLIFEAVETCIAFQTSAKKACNTVLQLRSHPAIAAG